jgi:acyl-CoA-dependent ceramide synthase
MPAQPDYFFHLFWPFKNLDGVICLNTEVKYIFLGMLLLLHTLSSIWFIMILKVIGGILLGKPAEDIRSDDEGEKQQDFKIEDLNPCTGGGTELDVEIVGTSTMASRFSSELDDLSPCTGAGTEMSDVMMGTSAMARASSKSRPTIGRRRLMGTENRKELLARIGCEKPI